jgi:hypothetical protein
MHSYKIYELPVGTTWLTPMGNACLAKPTVAQVVQNHPLLLWDTKLNYTTEEMV